MSNKRVCKVPRGPVVWGLAPALDAGPLSTAQGPGTETAWTGILNACLSWAITTRRPAALSSKGGSPMTHALSP